MLYKKILRTNYVATDEWKYQVQLNVQEGASVQIASIQIINGK